MQIGVSIPFRTDPAETIRLAEIADRVGLDFLSMGHHVFTPDYPSASPFTMLAAIASRTERIKLASIIFLLPLHHPVAVAEQVATLDMISKGRVIFGVGVGYRPYEFEGFGVDPARRGPRTSQALAAIRQAWSTGRWGFEGEDFTIPDLPAVPLPVQKPHPPIWVGGVSGPALRRAAKLGDGWVTANMQPLDDLNAMIATYRGHCDTEGRKPFVCVSRDTWVSATREDMMRDWYDDTLNRHLAFKRMGFASSDPQGVMDRLDRGEPVDPQDFLRDRAVGGTAEDCIAQISGWRDKTGADAFLLLLNKKASFEQLCDVVERFGRDVLPGLR